MPRVKKQYKKQDKKRKQEPKNKNKNKNKNIIKINVSNSSGGGGGSSSIIPIPYASSIGSQMYPSSSPVNIYNTLARNPYSLEYKNENEKIKEQNPTLSNSILTQTEPATRNSISTQTDEFQPKIKPELQPELQPKFEPLTPPPKFTNTPQLAIGLVEELRKKQEQRAFKQLTQPTPNLDDLYIKDKPLPRTEGILSPIGKYEYNPIASITEAQVKEQLKQEGKTNAQIGQLILNMKRRGELPF